MLTEGGDASRSLCAQDMRRPAGVSPPGAGADARTRRRGGVLTRARAGAAGLYLNHLYPRAHQFVTSTLCHASTQHLSSNMFPLLARPRPALRAPPPRAPPPRAPPPRSRARPAGLSAGL